MHLLFKKVTAILEQVQTTSGQCFNVLKWRALYRIQSDASTEQILGSAFLPVDVHSTLFRVSVFAI